MDYLAVHLRKQGVSLVRDFFFFFFRLVLIYPVYLGNFGDSNFSS